MVILRNCFFSNDKILWKNKNLDWRVTWTFWNESIYNVQTYELKKNKNQLFNCKYYKKNDLIKNILKNRFVISFIIIYYLI